MGPNVSSSTASALSGRVSEMQPLTLFLLASVLAVALAGGQYYVPRAYYTIDETGHASAPVPLRRLRRAATFYPGLRHNANSVAETSDGGSSLVNAEGSADPYPARHLTARGAYNIRGSYGSAKPLGA